MALALLLRNTGKLNALVRNTNISNVRCFSNILSIRPQNLSTTRLASKPLSLVKPTCRTFQLSTVRKSAAGSNHATIWKLERILAASMLGIVPAAFLAPSQATDALFVLAMILHAHWGVEAIVVDYVRPSVVGPLMPKVAIATLYLASIVALSGLMYLIYNDIGVAPAIKKFWEVHYKEPEPEPVKGKGKKAKNKVKEEVAKTDKAIKKAAK